MTEFTASNGVTVSSETLIITGHRRITFKADGKEERFEMSGAYAKALIETLDAEKDRELGRWRYPADARYVVYGGYSPGEEKRFARVVNEQLGIVSIVYEGRCDRSEVVEIADAYFEAHPERKPWHSAEAGEVWVLSIDDSEDIPCIVMPSGPDFEPIAHPVWATFARGSDRITAGRRIWPEEDAS